MVRRAAVRHVRARQHRDRARVRARCTSTPTGTGRSSRPKPDMVLHPTCPLARGGGAGTASTSAGRAFDDFIPELTFEQFDADAYAELLDDAGMRYLVHVTKHHDGFCWWDTAYSPTGTSAQLGPKRDVIAELADAVRRRGPRVRLLLLAARLGARRLSRSGRVRRRVHAAADPGAGRAVRARGALGRRALGPSRPRHWRVRPDRRRRPYVAAERGFELVFNDRFFASDPDFVVFEYDVPDTSARSVRGSCAAVSAIRSASTATSASRIISTRRRSWRCSSRRSPRVATCC